MITTARCISPRDTRQLCRLRRHGVESVRDGAAGDVEACFTPTLNGTVSVDSAEQTGTTSRTVGVGIRCSQETPYRSTGTIQYIMITTARCISRNCWYSSHGEKAYAALTTARCTPEPGVALLSELELVRMIDNRTAHMGRRRTQR